MDADGRSHALPPWPPGSCSPGWDRMHETVPFSPLPSCRRRSALRPRVSCLPGTLSSANTEGSGEDTRSGCESSDGAPRGTDKERFSEAGGCASGPSGDLHQVQTHGVHDWAAALVADSGQLSDPGGAEPRLLCCPWTVPVQQGLLVPVVCAQAPPEPRRRRGACGQEDRLGHGASVEGPRGRARLPHLPAAPAGCPERGGRTPLLSRPPASAHCRGLGLRSPPPPPAPAALFRGASGHRPAPPRPAREGAWCPRGAQASPARGDPAAP